MTGPDATADLSMSEFLGDDAPSNWGRWGPDDEVGALNHLDAAEVLRGVAAIRRGEVFTLQAVMGHPHGDMEFPGREQINREMIYDQDSYAPGGDGPRFKGGIRYSDDRAMIYLQGSTQYDALGHVWYDDTIWNGRSADTTNGGQMNFASVLPIAERGIAGHAVLLDVAGYRGKDWLDKGESFDHHDLQAIAAAQGVAIAEKDILVLRTGWPGYWYSVPHEQFYTDLVEPGLRYSRELVEWMQDKKIPNLVSDTMGIETTIDPGSGVALPLHASLLRNLGISFTEVAMLDDLAAACAAHGQWDFLYTAAPLKIAGGAGAPVNPLVIA